MSLLRSLRGVTALAVFAAAAWGQQPSAPRNVPNHTPSAVQSQPDIFTPTADAKLAVDNALQSAQNAGRRVLVVYGGVWCAQCPALQKIIESAPDTAPMVSQGFVTVWVNTDDLPTLQQFALKLDPDLKLTRDNGPLLTILDKNGTLLDARLDTRLLDKGSMSSAKVAKYLNRWTLEAPANEVYQKQLAQLRPVGKLGFVEFGADWCVWCHRMDKFFDQSPATVILHDYFIRIPVDYERNEGAPELARQLGAPAGDGLPLWAFVDADGKTLANSNSAKGNIGFPGTKEEIAEFVAILQSTAKGITPEQVRIIEKALQEQQPN